PDIRIGESPVVNRLSRRTFARLFGSAALAPAALTNLPTSASGQTAQSATTARSFPQGFLWGSATASYQVEGAVNEHGRGPFHWDLPQALEDKGGWQSRDTSEAFATYAGYVAQHLSDRVKHFMTLNEMRSFVDIGYKDGRHAPGLKLPPAGVNQVRHHAVLAH